MKLRYQDAKDSLDRDEKLNLHDKRISAFLKGEKFNPLLKPSKPRMIMARSPRFNLEISTYLKPLEHALWRRLKGTCKGVVPTRVVGKGLNGRERASLIAEKMGEIGGDCVVFEVDGKAFEAHCTRADLVREHSVYRAVYKGDQMLDELLSTQLTLKGETVCGIKFRRDGCRASGDFNTGMGNTIIMIAACRAAMRYLKEIMGVTCRWDMIVDGDNALIFVDGGNARVVHDSFASAVSAVSAQELTVENPVTRLEQVVFGQSKPVHNGDVMVMVRDPAKVLSNSFSGYRYYNHYEKFGVKVLKAVASCELALAIGIPVLQAYFSAAVDALGEIPDLTDPTQYLEGRLIEAVQVHGLAGLKRIREKVRPITVASRQSFAIAWNISMETQLDLEKGFSTGLKFPGTRSWVSRRLGVGVVNWDFVPVWDGPDGGAVDKMTALFLDGRY